MLNQIRNGYSGLPNLALPQVSGIYPHGVLNQLHAVLHHLKLLRGDLEILLNFEHIRDGLLIAPVRIQLNIAIRTLNLLHHLLAAHVSGVFISNNAFRLQQPRQLDST